MSEKGLRDITRRDFIQAAASGFIGIGLEACDSKDKARRNLESKKLNELELHEYIKRKKIVVFGGTHNPNSSKDAQIFINLIPQLKTNGFTDIALELDHKKHQQTIDQYLQTGDDTEITKQISVYVDGAKELSIIKAIKATGQPLLKIICYDDRQLENYHGLTEQNDRQQLWAEREDHGFKTIEQVLDQNKSARVAIYTNEVHIPNSEVSTFQFGNQPNGSPILVQLKEPLGYRLMKKYGNAGAVGIINLAESTPTEVR